MNTKTQEHTFPEPKKPVIMVAGILLSGGILVTTPESSVSAAEVAAEAAVNPRQNRLFGCFEVAETVQAKNLRPSTAKFSRFLLKKRAVFTDGIG